MKVIPLITVLASAVAGTALAAPPTLGPVDVNVTNASIAVDANSTLPVQVTNSLSIPVDVTNATSIPVQVSNSSLPVSVTNSTMDVNVTNTSIPVNVQPSWTPETDLASDASVLAVTDDFTLWGTALSDDVVLTHATVSVQSRGGTSGICTVQMVILNSGTFGPPLAAAAAIYNHDASTSVPLPNIYVPAGAYVGIMIENNTLNDCLVTSHRMGFRP